MDGEWQVVPGRRRAPKQPRGRRRGRKGSAAAGKNAQLALADEEGVLSAERATNALERCRGALERSGYAGGVAAAVQRAIGSGRRLREVVCYGVGPFLREGATAARWQLALAMLLRRLLQEGEGDGEGKSEGGGGGGDGVAAAATGGAAPLPMSFLDPACGEAEAAFLAPMGVDFVAANDAGLRQDAGGDAAAVTLFFMPHCPLQLYSNLLWSSWAALDGVIIVGNSFKEYAFGLNCCDHQHGGGGGGGSDAESCVHLLAEACSEEDLATAAAIKAIDGHRDEIERAFNNTGLMHFPPPVAHGGGLPERPPAPPKCSHSHEMITEGAAAPAAEAAAAEENGRDQRWR